MAHGTIEIPVSVTDSDYTVLRNMGEVLEVDVGRLKTYVYTKPEQESIDVVRAKIREMGLPIR